jgi:hypothetical protein
MVGPANVGKNKLRAIPLAYASQDLARRGRKIRGASWRSDLIAHNS